VIIRYIQIAIPLIFFGVFPGTANLYAQVYQNEFLSIGIGARGQAMMNANVASSSDVFSTFWNPAGLTRIEAPLQIGAMHAEWFTGAVKHDYLGIAKSLDETNKSFAAISVIRNGVDNIPNTLNLYDSNGAINYDNISEFSYASYGIFLSYARALKNQNWRVGANTKILYSQAGPFGKAWGIGIDLSLLYEKNGFIFSVLGRDITTTYNRWTYTFTDEQKEVFLLTGNEILAASTEITRPSLIPAVGYKFQFKNYSLLTELMGHMTIDGQRNVLVSTSSFNIDPAMGLEVGYKELLFIRGGLGNFQRIRNIVNPEQTNLTLRPAFGLGLVFGRLYIDYALTNVGQSANNRYSHIFSAILSFKTREKQS
jgi:hypothetical protein